MKRRQFLQWLGGAGIAASGLIVPHRSIFLPPMGGWPQVAIGSFIIPKWLIGDYADGIAKGHFAYDEATETMSLFKHDPERAQVDGMFHSAHTGRTYDFYRAGDEPGYRAAIDDSLDTPSIGSVDRYTWQMQYPAMALPQSKWGITPDQKPIDEHQRRAMDQVRADAVALGIPFVGDTYVIDTDKWFQTDHYRQWFASQRV